MIRARRWKQALLLVLILVVVGLGALKVGEWLPLIGDPDTPANAYVSQYYIRHAEEESDAPNMVTAVLADYRGFDTLFETCVMFLSGLSVLMILSTKEKIPVPKTKAERKAYQVLRQRQSFNSSVMDTAFRVIIPLLFIYGFYVLFHGEISPGGGFQAGAVFACAYLLDRIITDFDTRIGWIHEANAVRIAGLGAALYALAGTLPMLSGRNFLNYDGLALGLLADSPALHAAGILMIEIGVTLCVMGVIVGILETLLERTDFYV